MSAADRFDWEAWPLIPAVVQNPVTSQVLMVGFMNREALERSVSTGQVTFYSRSRQTLWTKGETSGNVLQIQELRINCEENSLLVLAHPHGPTCHTGHQTCYFRRIEADGSLTEVVKLPPEPGPYAEFNPYYDPDINDFEDSPESRMTRLWYGAYEYLRDNDLSEVSGTSKRLRDLAFPFEARLADELLELAGVLDGTHSHHGLIEDVLLEGSQVFYWTICHMIHNRITWDDLGLESAILASAHADVPPLEKTAADLRKDAERWRTQSPAETHTGHYYVTSAFVSLACRAVGIDPLSLIHRDLDDLKTRDYLQPYFCD